MRRPPVLLTTTLAVGLLLAACASPAGSGEPGASSGSEPSAAPAASDGGGGGGIGTGSGSVQFQINGGFSDSGELPFAGNFAYFQQAGVSFLVFTDDTAATEANGVILTLSADGNVFQYVTDEIVVPAGTCDWNITRNDATGAAGSFECNDQSGFATDGQVYTDLDISGTFEVNN
ncbi:MAG: hypothetical protein ACRDE9_00845, partial [Candidatus Limnocylindria bacterium]